MHERKNKLVQNYNQETLKGKHNLGDLRIDGMIMFK